MGLVAFENVASIYFGGDILKAGVISVGYNGIGYLFEFAEVVDNEASEKEAAVGERRLIHNDGGTFAFIRFMTPWMLL